MPPQWLIKLKLLFMAYRILHHLFPNFQPSPCSPHSNHFLPLIELPLLLWTSILSLCALENTLLSSHFTWLTLPHTSDLEYSSSKEALADFQNRYMLFFILYFPNTIFSMLYYWSCISLNPWHLAQCMAYYCNSANFCKHIYSIFSTKIICLAQPWPQHP